LEDQDPDLVFGLMMNHLVEGTIYDDEVQVRKLLDDIYQIRTNGTNDELSIGATVVINQYEHPMDAEVFVFATTKVNDYRFETTLFVDYPWQQKNDPQP
jgi:hypothetical protein